MNNIIRNALGWLGFGMAFWGMYIIHPSPAYIICGSFLYWITVKVKK